MKGLSLACTLLLRSEMPFSLFFHTVLSYGTRKTAFCTHNKQKIVDTTKQIWKVIQISHVHAKNTLILHSVPQYWGLGFSKAEKSAFRSIRSCSFQKGTLKHLSLHFQVAYRKLSRERKGNKHCTPAPLTASSSDSLTYSRQAKIILLNPLSSSHLIANHALR